MQTPTVADLAEHLGGIPEDSAGLDDALAAGVAWVTDRVRCDPLSAQVRLAMLHEAARLYWAKGAPGGLLEGGDFGAVYVPSRAFVRDELLGGALRGGFA